MGDMVVLENHSREQRSFRLRLTVGKKRQAVKDGLMVVVPGRDPLSGQLGVSDPFPREMLEAEAKSPFLVKLFETGVLTFKQVV
jgi:hypothetical protein